MQQNSNTTCGIRPVCVWVNKLKVVQETYRVVCFDQVFVCLFVLLSQQNLVSTLFLVFQYKKLSCRSETAHTCCRRIFC